MALVRWARHSWAIGKTCPQGQFAGFQLRLLGVCSAGGSSWVDNSCCNLSTYRSRCSNRQVSK
jgi:hypothetical protein